MGEWKSGFKSMGWQIQSWYALILLVVVIGLMAVIYHFEKQKQISRLDLQAGTVLQYLLPELTAGALNRARGPASGATDEFRPGPKRPRLGPPRGNDAERPRPRPNGPGPRRGGPYPPDRAQETADEPLRPGRPSGPRAGGAEPRPEDVRRSESMREFQKIIDNGAFAIAWNSALEETYRNGILPEGEVYREARATAQFEQIGNHRVVWELGPARQTIAVGLPITTVDKKMASFIWTLVAFGTAIVSIAMLVGIVIVRRSLRPITEISKTASEISHGDLSQRIDVEESQSELGTLSEVLNECFERLEENFNQQQRFTADASHELRTPVSVLLSTSQRMLARPRREEEFRKAFELCERSALRMKRLVDELTELARFDSGEIRLDLEEVSLDVVAGCVVHDLRPILEEQNAVLNVDLKPASVRIDTARIEQVITNMVMNALRHNPPGVTINVRSWSEEGNAWLEISDDGHGIPTEMQELIFDRFSQLDAVRSRGSGLGLAICKVIVEGHGGSIELESAPRQGSRFRVRLPGLSTEPTP